MSGPGLGSARRLVVERDLVRAAFEHLTVDAFMTLPFEALGPTKALLKRFFSLEPWTPEEDDALAAAVGTGEGRWQRALDTDVTLDYGWTAGRFEIRATSAAALTATPAETLALTPAETTAHEPAPVPASKPAHRDSLADTFDGPVVPEATPNPRTIRFQVGAIHDGPSRWYESAVAATDDPAAYRLFAEFDEVANVLVGPDFVAVGLRRANDWERLLRPVLAAVTEELSSPDSHADDGPPRVMGGPAGAGVAGAGMVEGGATSDPAAGRRLSRLERAWKDLGSLRPSDLEDLAAVRAAAAGNDSARRQVAASLLREADAATAAVDWSRLATDQSRSVRRAAIDAMVDVGREELRPLLEGALADADAWIRWKALRGLAELGSHASHEAIAARADDPDFRVRLEAAAALR